MAKKRVAEDEPPVEALQDETLFEAPAPEDAVVEDAHVEAPKRKRGRPPKNPDAKTDMPPRAPKPRGRPPKQENILPPIDVKKALSTQLMMAAAIFELRDPYCGAIAKNQVPAITESLFDWAQSDPKVMSYLTMGSKGGGPLGVAFAATPIVLAMLQHHGPAGRRAQAAAQAQWEYEQQMQYEAQQREQNGGENPNYARGYEEETPQEQPMPSWAGMYGPGDVVSDDGPFASSAPAATY